MTAKQAEQIKAMVGEGDANELLEQFIQQTAEARRVRQLQVLATTRASNAAGAHPSGRGRGVESLLARDTTERASSSNADFRARAIYDKARAMAADAYEKLGVRRLGLVTDDALADRVGRAMFGQSVDPEADKLGKELSSAMDMVRQRFNVAGGNIPKRKDFGLPQTHDARRIAAASKQEWVDFTLARVRRVYSGNQVIESPEFIRKFLEATYDQAAENSNQLASGAGGIKLESESRRIVFRGYDDWSEYSKRFGHGEKNLLNIVDEHLRGMSREVGLMEILGPRPTQTLGQLVDEAAKSGQLTPWQRGRIERLYAVVSGQVDEVQSQ